MIARRRQWVSAVLVAAVLVLTTAVTRGADEPKNGKDAKDLSQVPKAVMDALKAKFTGATIEKWSKETENGKVIYDFEFKHNGRKTEADIAEDGTIQNFEREFDAKNLPKAVSDTVQKKYPGATMKEVLEITEIEDGKEVHGGFEIVVQTADGKTAEMTVAKDGKVLEESAGD